MQKVLFITATATFANAVSLSQDPMFAQVELSPNNPI